jgi:hypothetical protein
MGDSMSGFAFLFRALPAFDRVCHISSPFPYRRYPGAHVFFRPFNLFLDAQFVPDLIHLLYTTFSLKTFIFAAILAVILLAGISWGVWLSFKTIHIPLAYHRNRRVVLVMIVAGLMVLPNLPDGGIRLSGALLAKGVFHRVIEEFNFILHVKGHRARHLGEIESAMKAGDQIPSSLDRLHGANVFLYFVVIKKGTSCRRCFKSQLICEI